MLRFLRQGWMCQKSERAESVIRAHYHQPQPRKRGAKRRHLAVALSVASTMEVNQYRTIGVRAKLRSPDIQVQTVFIALDVRKPRGWELQARRTGVDGFASSSPFSHRFWRFPPKLARWRCPVRDTEKRSPIRLRTEMDALKQAALDLYGRFWLLALCIKRADTAELQGNQTDCSPSQLPTHKGTSHNTHGRSLRIGSRVFSAKCQIPCQPVVARLFPGLLDLVRTQPHHPHAIQYGLAAWSTACTFKFC